MSCTSIAPIPLPADDCDRLHSLHAALSSLGAAAASFDATMDSLLATVAMQRRRVENLEIRTTRFREALHRLDDSFAPTTPWNGGEGMDDSPVDGGGCTLRCSSTYEEALLGLGQVEGGLSEIRVTMSATNSARCAANDAIRLAMSKDMHADDGMAVPSDAWLDHASSRLDVERALELTSEMRSVPLILGEDVGRGESDYRRILETLARNAATKIEGFDCLEGGCEGREKADDETVYTTTSQTSSMSMASSSTRMTAGQRKRWHKQQQMKMQMQGTTKAGGMKSSSTQIHTVLFPHMELPPPTTHVVVAGRQQSHVGSQPYLCEVFHDSYGVGLEPPQGLVECPGFSPRGTREGGTEFYTPSSHVTDLHVFNTARNSYGPATTTKTCHR